ncbi:ribosomal-processing cysteine protease Prp [Ligilactobacillus murinus]|uniref:Ribosomal processing cysteine protease Prp n=1 Tax=Ligilactobacillus murinus TaxID=1622 RepID=A0AAE7BRA6_9LACO|nr:ribosomal-processing cysteine protease Prp [Ligilactobacillus murinus]NEF83030.1 ribosomal-processing cysteine protease Prp [Ligilactobacillus murinus]NEF84999.1 ribosomal-processing cysteine protease Prp [Ligilactobacillus murinus]NEF87585.1 ribosomal-processing cysteine protease Prp [Ligilactobacillus murinus]NEF89909.1 ribosomal-processing cysteine protease Prp [Ligilactobacillus murinus]NEF92187.1 ribosomal-processing cysteine protease Prp [Ligilactobacillus murinus]
MIHANIIRNGKVIEGFDITGHAGFAKAGEDIVCAAVSVLAINTINTLEKLLKQKFELVEDQKNGGLLQVALSDEGQNDPAVQLILSSLELGLRDVEQSYPKYIKTNIN